MSPLLARYERFLRLDTMPDAASLLRGRGVYIMGWTFIAIQIINQGFLFQSYGGWSFDHTVSTAGCFLVLCLMHAIRWYRRFPVYACIYSLLLFGGVWASAVIDGQTGINSALLPLVLAGSILSGFIAGWRSVIVYTAFAIGFLLALYNVSVNADTLIYIDVALDRTRAYQRAVQAVLGLLLISTMVGLTSYHMYSLFDGLERTAKKARAADWAKSQFLANMSHELRTPLNGVIGMSELLVKTQLDQTQRVYADIVAKSSRSLISIVDDVLDLSRIDAGKVRISKEPVQLETLMEGLMSLHKPAALEKNLELELNYAAHVPRTIIGDAGRLRQIMSNMIGNAVKFTREGHVKVWVDGRHADSFSGDTPAFELFVCVQDTGIGIAEADLHKVFERFEQIDNKMSRSYEGTGLGLTISKEFIEAMGGAIWVKSTPGQGSMFSVNLVADIVGTVETATAAPAAPRLTLEPIPALSPAPAQSSAA